VRQVTIFQLGTAVGLLSLTFFFGALVMAFGLRIAQQQTWQRFELPSVMWLGTLLLVASSWTLEGARRALRRAMVSVYRGRILATLGLAALFLGVQLACATDLLGQGVAASANPHGSAFYAFMGIHGAHLFGGIGWMSYLHRRARALYRSTESDLRHQRRITAAAAMYWHFMGVLWVVLFAFLLNWTRG
jgi:cytochrome c oxidase subunit 3